MPTLAAANGAAATEQRSCKVLVTGFGPFKKSFPINPSHLIATSLPPTISLAQHPTPKSPTISVSIVALQTPVRVSYRAVQDLVPALYKDPQYADLDLVVHIGMASGRKWFTMEEKAERKGYRSKDVDGEELDGGEWKDAEGVKPPEKLWTTAEAEDVWRRWKDGAPDLDVRPSRNAGRFLCEYLYYSSMAHFWAMDRGAKEVGDTSDVPLASKRTQVIFLHVPGESSESDLERGRTSTISVIRALISSQRRLNEKNEP